MIINGTDYGDNYNVSLKEHKDMHRDLLKFRGMSPEEVDLLLEEEYYLATGKKKPVKKLKAEDEPA